MPPKPRTSVLARLLSCRHLILLLPLSPQHLPADHSQGASSPPCLKSSWSFPVPLEQCTEPCHGAWRPCVTWPAVPTRLRPCQALCPQGAPWHLPLPGPRDCPPALCTAGSLASPPTPRTTCSVPWHTLTCLPFITRLRAPGRLTHSCAPTTLVPQLTHVS